MRLDKLLADMQIGTRNKVKQLIRQGAVTVDGAVQTAPDLKVDPNRQKICCFGKDLRYTEYVYYMFYKPKGCVTAHRDAMHPTVMDYIDCGRRGLSPVGRLDLDTEGLLLITNDGELSHNLLSPAKHVSKVYEAKISGCVTKEDVEKFAAGLEIGDESRTRHAKLEILPQGGPFDVRVTVTEGRYHQIKRMFAAVGQSVLELKRIRMGSVALDPSLHPGEYRMLSDEEIKALKTQEEAGC